MKDRVLFVADRPCLPVRDGFSQRTSSWIRFLIEDGWDVSFLSFNTPWRRWDRESVSLLAGLVADYAIIDDYDNGLYQGIKRPVKFAYYLARGHFYSSDIADRMFLGKVHARIRDYIDGRGASIMLVNLVESVPLIGAENVARFRGRRIVDIHDLQAEHNRMTKTALRKVPFTECVGGAYSGFLAQKVVSSLFDYRGAWAQELAWLSLFDTVLPTSVREYGVLSGVECLAGKVAYLPPLMPLREPAPSGGGMQENTFDFAYIGGPMLFNIEAMDHFGRRILPRILELKPHARFLVGGAICRVARKLFGASPCVEYADNVRDLDAFYGSTRAVVVPLLSGTGVSVKTLEAMSYGRPVVSTSPGVRGLEVRDGEDVLVEDDPLRFAERLVGLLADDAAMRRLSEGAARTIAEKYSPARHREALRSILRDTHGAAVPRERVQ